MKLPEFFGVPIPTSRVQDPENLNQDPEYFEKDPEENPGFFYYLNNLMYNNIVPLPEPPY
jgi:hypothetical protein